MRPLYKIIDLNALRHNIQLLRKNQPRFMAVIKADAYGHGVAALRPVLDECCDSLAVACIEEALQLRQLGYRQNIILLEGIFDAEEIPLLKQHAFTAVVHSPWQLEALAAQGLPFWLKVDSGMHRLGFAPEEALSHLEKPGCLGYFSHFACADEADLSASRKQLERLKIIPASIPRLLCNSAAALAGLDGEGMRAGLAIYGLSPLAHRSAADLGLRPVMTLRTEIIALRRLQRGDTAGYGAAFCAPEEGYLATLALGYGDGFPRQIRSGAVHLRLGEALYPLVGRVSMDMSLLWLGKNQAAIGSEVIVFGEKNPAEQVARQADTIPYTLSTMLTARVPSRIRGLEHA